MQKKQQTEGKQIEKTGDNLRGKCGTEIGETKGPTDGNFTARRQSWRSNIINPQNLGVLLFAIRAHQRMAAGNFGKDCRRTPAHIVSQPVESGG